MVLFYEQINGFVNGILNAFVNGIFKKKIDTTFMENIKSCQKISYFSL